jgi:hypothetical protein
VTRSSWTRSFRRPPEINGYKHESLHIVERQPADVNTLSYEATIEDPNVFAQPWVIRRFRCCRVRLVERVRVRNNRDTNRCSATNRRP